MGAGDMISSIQSDVVQFTVVFYPPSGAMLCPVRVALFRWRVAQAALVHLQGNLWIHSLQTFGKHHPVIHSVFPPLPSTTTTIPPPPYFGCSLRFGRLPHANQFVLPTVATAGHDAVQIRRGKGAFQKCVTWRAFDLTKTFFSRGLSL